jgi:CspA family cold shock protein
MTKVPRRAESRISGAPATTGAVAVSFIQPQNGGKSVFVRITTVPAAGLNGLDEGQKVTFEVVRERGKEAAANLKLG